MIYDHSRYESSCFLSSSVDLFEVGRGDRINRGYDQGYDIIAKKI